MGKPTNTYSARGATFNTSNRFLKQQHQHWIQEAIDDWEVYDKKTTFIEEHAKTLVNQVTSPDVGMYYSMNPYQGCEHGCSYCYARNAHEYWGLSAGLDFEQKIIVKKNAPELLRKFLMQKEWTGTPISLSGNTDCYQPAEKKFEITKQLLQVCLQFKQPVAIITKNAGILRDAHLLAQLAAQNLAMVMVTITTLNHQLRRTMEPRTTTPEQRLKVIEQLSKAGIPCGIMIGPVIPGLNDHEIHHLLKTAASAGAISSAYTFVRLNGSVQFIFRAWLYHHYAHKADKVWNMITQAHGGQVNDTRFGLRMRGEGPLADLVYQQFKKYSKLYGLASNPIALDSSKFCPPGHARQGILF